MRVISGKYRSIKLNAPEGTSTRPTTDKVKESIFNMIYCRDVKVLDLFAGSGALGIEALSRGAKYAYFIDGNKDALKIINGNLKKCKIDNTHYAVFKNDYLRALKLLSKQAEKFDLIFLDPPYKKNLIESSLEQIIALNLCNDECYIVCEYSNEEDINFTNDQLEVIKEKNYGYINIRIYEYREK